MKKYENKKFERETFVIEECYFVNCVLRDCDLFYSGGGFEWTNLNFDNCRFHWRGPADQTIKLLTALGFLKPQTPPQITGTSSSLAN